jgi:SAM-dependent methyltransferase
VSQAHFDSIAGIYDESLPAHVVEHYLDKRTRFVLEHCVRGRGLDVGCGTGALAARLAAAGYEMTGVDPSGGMLDLLRSRAPEVRAVEGSGSSLPFPDDSFDLVLSVAVMHHVADPEDVRHTLAEMVRVARPAGRILVWDHNPRNRYWGSLMARVPQDTGDERLITEAELHEGLRAAGAEILVSRQLGMVPDFVPRAALRAAAAAERAVEHTPLLRALAAHNVVLAAKEPSAAFRPISETRPRPAARRSAPPRG